MRRGYPLLAIPQWLTIIRRPKAEGDSISCNYFLWIRAISFMILHLYLILNSNLFEGYMYIMTISIFVG
jgi:hypothetical protein